MRRKPVRKQYSAPPTHHADSLAYRQSEYLMAQMADSHPPQTLLVESDQTTSERLLKLQMQLNTPNRNVPDLIQVSPNASDIQRLGRSVPAFRDVIVAPYCFLVHWSLYRFAEAASVVDASMNLSLSKVVHIRPFSFFFFSHKAGSALAKRLPSMESVQNRPDL